MLVGGKERAVSEIIVDVGDNLVELIGCEHRGELVRCKECRWLDKGENESCSWSMCTRHFGQYINVSADDYCSYGEKGADDE